MPEHDIGRHNVFGIPSIDKIFPKLLCFVDVNIFGKKVLLTTSLFYSRGASEVSSLEGMSYPLFKNVNVPKCPPPRSSRKI